MNFVTEFHRMQNINLEIARCYDVFSVFPEYFGRLLVLRVEHSR